MKILTNLLLMTSSLIISCSDHERVPNTYPAEFLTPNTILGVNYAQSDNGFSDLELETYINVFISEWSKKYPYDEVKIKRTLSLVEFHWQPNVFRSPSQPWDSRTFLGYTQPGSFVDQVNLNKIYVFIALADGSERFPIEQTSLGHELVHIFLGAMTGNMEPDHLNSGTNKWPLDYERFLSRVRAVYLIKMETYE